MKEGIPETGDIEIASGMGMCDFCSPPQPTLWIYPCESFVLPVQIAIFGDRYQESVGDWGACETCSELIEKGHKEKLARRSGILFKMGVQQATVDAFFEHRIDKPRYKREEPFVVFDEAIVYPDGRPKCGYPDGCSELATKGIEVPIAEFRYLTCDVHFEALLMSVVYTVGDDHRIVELKDER